MKALFDPAYQRYPSQRYPIYARGGMVNASSPQAAAAGLEILRRGGNAMDAAVAAAAMLGICGERAAREARGPGSLRAALLDAAYTLTPEELDHEAAVRPFEKG